MTCFWRKERGVFDAVTEGEWGANMTERFEWTEEGDKGERTGEALLRVGVRESVEPNEDELD